MATHAPSVHLITSSTGIAHADPHPDERARHRTRRRKKLCKDAGARRGLSQHPPLPLPSRTPAVRSLRELGILLLRTALLQQQQLRVTATGSLQHKRGEKQGKFFPFVPAGTQRRGDWRANHRYLNLLSRDSTATRESSLQSGRQSCLPRTQEVLHQEPCSRYARPCTPWVPSGPIRSHLTRLAPTRRANSASRPVLHPPAEDKPFCVGTYLICTGGEACPQAAASAAPHAPSFRWLRCVGWTTSVGSRPIWEASDAHWPATQQSPPSGRSAAAGVAAGCARALLARASMWSKAACLVERKKSFDLRKYTAEPALTDSTSSRCTLSENWSKGSPVSVASIDRLSVRSRGGASVGGDSASLAASLARGASTRTPPHW